MELIREKTCCFTGHRKLPPRDGLLLRARLREEIEKLLEIGVDTFLAGGALGFDTMAAQEVLKLREEGFPLCLVLVLPCLGQESRWTQRDAAVYHGLIRQADEVIYTGDEYSRGCMFVRNRYLVDHSAYCLCCLFGNTARGGTAYTVDLAGKQGLAVINLAESLLPENT